jgi:hypothetical protein
MKGERNGFLANLEEPGGVGDTHGGRSCVDISTGCGAVVLAATANRATVWKRRAAVYYRILPWLLPWFGMHTGLNPRFLLAAGALSP